MAASIRAIKDRINSVSSMKKITHAMELVSSSKFRRTRERAEARRAYTAYIISSLQTIAAAVDAPQNTFLIENGVEKDLYIVITSDKGLAGGFNSNLLKYAQALMNESGRPSAVLAVGNKSAEYFTRRPAIEVLGTYTGKSESPSLEFSTDIANTAMNLYKNKVVGNVYVVYNRFISVISQRPSHVKLFPLTADLTEVQDEVDSFGFEFPVSTAPRVGKSGYIMTFEPDAEELLEYLVPRYIINAIYGACIENSAGEQAARKTAMENATENADEMIAALSLSYNRARQAAITQELTEIIAGADAIG